MPRLLRAASGYRVPGDDKGPILGPKRRQAHLGCRLRHHAAVAAPSGLDTPDESESAPGWLFTTLYPAGSPQGQVLAIKDDSLSTQFLVYRNTSNYKPIALDVLPAEDPE